MRGLAICEKSVPGRKPPIPHRAVISAVDKRSSPRWITSVAPIPPDTCLGLDAMRQRNRLG
jgi:hypothetical protein